MTSFGQGGEVLTSRGKLDDLRERLESLDSLDLTPQERSSTLRSLCDEILALAESTHAELANRESDLQLLFDVNNRMVSILDLETLGEEIVDVVTVRMDLERCSLFLHDPKIQGYRLVAARGMDPALIGKIVVQPGEGIVGRVIETRKSLLLKDIEKESGFRKKSAAEYSTRSLLSVPLEMSGQVIGVINVNNKKNGTVFTEADRRLLETLSGTAAIALVNARLYDRTVQAMTYIQNIIENITWGILVVDRTGHITLCNKTTLNLVPTQDTSYQGRRLGEVFCPSFRVHLEEVFSRVWREGMVLNYELVMQDDLGRERALGITGSVLRDQNQEIIGALVLIQDLAQLRELEHLRHLDRMKTNFVACVSHELRTPLTSMIASIALLEGKTVGELNAQQMKLLSILSRNSQRLLALINDILDLSRLESGRVTLDLESIDLNEVVKRCTDSLTALANDRHVHLDTCKYEGERVLADGRRIEQVLVNLVGNALKFTPAGGNVAISAEARNGGIEVSVKDTGIGIPADQIEKVFQKFHQGEDTMTRTFAGTGLGLAISKHIVEMHGGRIWCESEPGKGSTFSFIIPQPIQNN